MLKISFADALGSMGCWEPAGRRASARSKAAFGQVYGAIAPYNFFGQKNSIKYFKIYFFEKLKNSGAAKKFVIKFCLTKTEMVWHRYR